VPKLAATLASLLLMASSIGVNIARYPQVGRTIHTAQANAAETANPPQAKGQTLPAETFKSDYPPAKTEVAADTVEEPRPLTAKSESIPDRTIAQAAAPVQKDIAVPIVDVRPMAPLARPRSNGGDSPAGGDVVRRLPPIEANRLTEADIESACTKVGAAYPTTSTP
jgi:hypothetical protein